jgi:hypothetical protein
VIEIDSSWRSLAPATSTVTSLPSAITTPPIAVLLGGNATALPEGNTRRDPRAVRWRRAVSGNVASASAASNVSSLPKSSTRIIAGSEPHAAAGAVHGAGTNIAVAANGRRHGSPSRRPPKSVRTSSSSRVAIHS